MGFRFMCRTLKEAKEELYNLRDQSPRVMAAKVLQFHIFVTDTPKSDDEWAKARDEEVDVSNPECDRKRDLALWGPRYDDRYLARDVNTGFSIEDIWMCLRKPC